MSMRMSKRRAAPAWKARRASSCLPRCRRPSSMISATCGLGQAGDQIANLAVGVMAGRVEQRRGQLDFERLGALDQIDQRAPRAMGRSFENSAAAWASSALGLDLVVVGLGVFDQRGRGADFAGEEAGRLRRPGAWVGSGELLDEAGAGLGVDVPGGAGGGFAQLETQVAHLGDRDGRAAGRPGFPACARSQSGRARYWWPAAAGSGPRRRRGL